MYCVHKNLVTVLDLFRELQCRSSKWIFIAESKQHLDAMSEKLIFQKALQE